MNTHPLHVNYKVIYLRDWIEEIKEFYRRKNTKLTSDEMVEGVFEDTFYLIRRIQETIGNNSQTKNILNNIDYITGYIKNLGEFFKEKMDYEVNDIDGIQVIEKDNGEIVFTYHNWELFAKKFSLPLEEEDA
jgi:hypothetical protein